VPNQEHTTVRRRHALFLAVTQFPCGTDTLRPLRITHAEHG
jgi:hypothetical protein